MNFQIKFKTPVSRCDKANAENNSHTTRISSKENQKKKKLKKFEQ